MNLQEEVICGFRVTEEQKHLNAVYLDLIREFDRLCRKNGLTWWLIFGGLIGAVRHKGFIPWDDDIDIGMPRKDFDRLQMMTNEQFGAEEPYFLQNAATQPDRATILIRLRRSDTTNIRDVDWEHIRKRGGTNENLGISLAVFPLDNYPKYEWEFRLQKWFFDLSFEILDHAQNDDRGIRHAISCGILRLVGRRRFNIIRHTYRLSKTNRSGKVHIFHTFYPGFDTHYRAEVFADTVFLPFEDITVPVPVGYDEMSRVTYGNYMEFPPPEKRKLEHGGLIRWDMPYREAVEKLLSGEIVFPAAEPENES